jgi:hypothetical protein
MPSRFISEIPQAYLLLAGNAAGEGGDGENDFENNIVEF